MKISHRNSLAAILVLLQWGGFLFLDVRPDFLVIACTYLLLELLPIPWLAIALQAPLVMLSPHGGLRALFFAVAFLLTRGRKVLPYRYGVLLIAAIFIVFARFEQFSLPILFPGIISGAAVVYAVSRVRGIGDRLSVVMTAYLIAILPYIALALFLEAGYHARPVVVMPLDLIQLVTVAVFFQSIGWEVNAETESTSSGAVESEDNTGETGGTAPAES